MAIKSRHLSRHTTYNYIFTGKDIIIKNNDDNSLPGIDLVDYYIEEDLYLDFYSENSTDKDINALLLIDDAPIPEGYKNIPLRQYFWITKTEPKALSCTAQNAARAHGFLSLRQYYKYCPSCGAPFSDHTQETALVCTGCNKLLFPRIEPAIIVLISKGNQILLAKNKLRPDFYSCIAGFVEHGESLEQCVQREVKEETGLEIQNIRYSHSQPWPFPDQLMLGFFAEYKSGDIVLQESELSDAQWFDLDNLPVIPKEGSIAYDLIHQFIKDHCND